ncbi:hypothetical protein [Streptomyces sp. MMG1121]|uniref:hypothetical protein n=1 Tax=Streptomyces sp. MMG1121 TaxID=1415544 RepID=UPI0006AF4C3B|nr:hypothetical protein [Streptomyces sp. MMG1121]KOV63513.1 hypothetical protein ADK64_20700 [Streptomyces sp. MMG1121]
MSNSASSALSLDVSWGSDAIRVTNVARQLPPDSTDTHLRSVTEAGRANPGVWLPDAAWEVIASATTRPDALAVQLRPTPDEPSGLLMVENVEGATLRSVVTRVLLSELFPGPQPRTGMEVSEVPDPQVHGITHDGRPGAIVQYRYQDPSHLRNHVWQTIHATLSLNSYATSILTRSVTRNLITHPVEIAFEDGTEPIHVLVVRDGITRLASAWAVLAGHGADPAEVAELATSALLGGSTVSATGSGLVRRLAAGRAQWRQTLRQEFDAEMRGATPGIRAAQIAQSYVVPAQIAVGVEGHEGRVLAPEDIFDDAVRSVLASVHVEFKQWDAAAQNVEVITRALKRIIQQGDPRWNTADLQAVYGLAVGRIPVAELPQVFGGEPAAEGTALWRAVYLISALTQPDLLELLKDQAKAIKGGQRMSMKGFGELLGPIVDLPWRAKKKLVTKQARNAWNNGGVLSADVTQGWSPVPTEDFTTLIEPAMNGDDDARRTLAVAGGVALIADKLLTRNVGSSLGARKDKGGVPFRSDVNKVIEGLSRPANELGLWTLALAANTFRSDDLPRNSVPKQSLTGKESAASDEPPYIYFKVDLDAKDRIAVDGDGVPVPLYEWDVVAASDPERMAKLAGPVPPSPSAPPAPNDETEPEQSDTSADETGETSGAADSGTPLFQFGSVGAGSGTVDGASLPGPRDEDLTTPPSQRAAAHRKALRLGVQAARDALDHLHTLEPEVGGHTPIVPMDQLNALHELLVGVLTDVENLRRRITPEEGEPREEESRAEKDLEDVDA